MPRVLFEDRFVSLTLDESLDLVRYVRTREPYPSIEAMRASNEATAKGTAWLPRGSLKLLLDLRAAPPSVFTTEAEALAHLGVPPGK